MPEMFVLHRSRGEESTGGVAPSGFKSAPLCSCLWDGHFRLPWLFPRSWKRLAAALEGSLPYVSKVVSTSVASSSSSTASHVPSSATAAVTNIPAEQAAWPIPNPDSWGIENNGTRVDSPLWWLTSQALWRTLTNIKPKGEISSVDCGAIQNNVNSLLLGIETLCFGAVTLRDDSAKRSQTEYDTVLLMGHGDALNKNRIKIWLRIDASLGQGW